MRAPELIGLARRYQAAHLRIAQAVTEALLIRWALDTPINDNELAVFASAAANDVRQAQETTARLAVSYIDTAVLDQPNWTPANVDLDPLLNSLRGGVPLETVYGRPVITARRVLSEGRTIRDALRVGADRLQRTVLADVQLASRAALDQSMQHHTPTIVGYRRVTDGNACRLCLLASTQRYHVGDLLPIHNRCGCTVVPIVGPADPGHIIDRETLQRIKEGDLDGARISARRFNEEVEVGDHGELGPVLQPRATRPKRKPGAGTRSIIDSLEFEGRPPPVLQELVDELGRIHGIAANDSLPVTKIRFRSNRSANARKGGHFTPGTRGTKPRRKKGEDHLSYSTRYRAWASTPLKPEILVIDRGDGTTALSFLHELGHRFDIDSADSARRYASQSQVSEAWRDFFTAAKATPTITEAYQRYRDINYVSYYRSAEEIWARAYSQWAATTLEHPGARAALVAAQARSTGYQWPDDEFDTLSQLVDRVLQDRGLLQ